MIALGLFLLGFALGLACCAWATARAAVAFSRGEPGGHVVHPLVGPILAGHARRQAALARALGGPRLVGQEPLGPRPARPRVGRPSKMRLW